MEYSKTLFIKQGDHTYWGYKPSEVADMNEFYVNIAAGIGADKPSPNLIDLSPLEAVARSTDFYKNHGSVMVFENDMNKFHDF